MLRDRKGKSQRDKVPEDFRSLEEFWAFWDTHSTADYEDLMEGVQVDVDVRSRKTYCALAQDLAGQIRSQARRQGVATETLVNLWLREKMMEAAKAG